MGGRLELGTEKLKDQVLIDERRGILTGNSVENGFI